MLQRAGSRVLRRLIVMGLALGLMACGHTDAPRLAGTDSLRQAHGEWLLINYWASWCRPCREEIPQLNAFAVKHGATARVLMVNFDGIRGEELRKQALSLGIETGLLEEDPAVHFSFPRPDALPATYLITPDAHLHRVLLGPQTVSSLELAMKP